MSITKYKSCISQYLKTRENVVKEEIQCAIGYNLELNEKENIVNEYLMKHKYKELDEGFLDPQNFLAGNHFFKVKDKVENSKVFEFIKKIPKGASLHSHDTAMASGEYLYSITFRDNLYGCAKDNGWTMQFFQEPPSSNWKLLSQLRTSGTFENFLKSKLTLVCDNPEVKYPNLNTVWTTFQNLFINLEKLICYKPIFKEYFYQALKETYEDNVKYIEFRGYLPTVYDLDGTEYGPCEVVGMYIEVEKQFKQDYPDFFGCKFIFGPHRMVDNVVMDNYVKIYKEIKTQYPEFVIGFDLVGQEDLGYPFTSFLPQLLEMKEFGCKFFFHAGETHWNGQSTDQNLVDAILLDTVRLGHAFALLKHPVLAKIVKEKGIAVEVCPISNQALKLIDDLRSHPASILIANNYPVVIGCDDPTFFGTKGISYDWYVTFMAICHRDSDLRLLKQLAINSLDYSALGVEEKERAKQQWQDEWKTFINTFYIHKIL
ncbi:unnamed protein product [Diabrotica balteata]|uniref:Adenosine deaminase n=1 Tax=Diabrotica balteata TaxID=107213 RepID=A0A9N9XFK9_DIABA|nr:unnamed protein product [Diabrotica balteata]